MHSRLLLTAAGLAGLLVACGGSDSTDPATDPAAGAAAGGPGGSEAQDPQRPKTPKDIYGFDVWVEGLPGAPDMPHVAPRRAGLVYDRTRSQAIEAIAAKLQGNCSRDAWLFAKDFFSRVEEPEDLDILVRTLDAALQAPEMSDHAENCLEAIGRAANPRLAPAIGRALEHSKKSVRNKAMRALVQSGDADAVRASWRFFSVVDGRGMEGWIQAAARHLPPEELGQTFRNILADERMQLVHKLVIEETTKLEPEVAVEVFRDFVGREPQGLRSLLAVMRHRAGDAGGSAMLKDMLRAEAPQTRYRAVAALASGGAEDFLDDLLKATTDPDPDVRTALVMTLSTIEGESVDLALDGLTLDEFVDVRRAALAALSQRGFSAPLEELVATVRRSTGTRLQAAMEDLVSARYPGAVPAFAERMRELQGEDRERMIRAIGITRTAEAFVVLRDEFLRDAPGAEEHFDIISITMANCRGAEFAMLELFDELAADDYLRKAYLIRTLANVAADRSEAEIKDAIYGRLRELVADQQEIPQIRLLALEFGRRGLGPEQISWLKAVCRQGGRPMRDALSDQLFEFF